MANYTPISIQALTQKIEPTQSLVPPKDTLQAMFDAKGTSKSEPAMISSAQGSSLVDQTNQKLQTLKGDPEENAKLLADAQKRLEAMKTVVDERAAKESQDKMTFVNPETGQETTLSGAAITDKAKADLKKQGYEVSDASISSSEPTALDKARADRAKAEQELSGFLGKLNNTAISSKELRQTIRRIEGVYNERIQAMQNINERRYKQLNTLGVRLGSRYTGGTGGVIGSILTEEERQGAARIAAIEAEMEAAINNAEKEAREFNFTLFTQQAEKAQEKYDEKVKAFQDLEEAQRKAEQEIKDEAELVEQQSNIIEQIELGKTDPVAIFTALNGQVPFDVITELTESIADTSKPVTLGSADLLVNPTTGEIIARGSKVGGGVSGGNVSAGFSIGAPGVSVGQPTVAGIGATYASSSPEAQMLIDDILNKIPVQLRNTEKETALKIEQIRKQLAAGYSYQDIVDRLSGFSLQGAADKAVGNTLYNLALGTDITGGDLASLLNRGATEQAMTTVENKQLEKADGFFANTDEARGTIKQADAVLNILNDPTFPLDKLGAFDGRAFKVGRFAGMTDKDMIKVQQLESALQLLNSPIRLAIAGTAVTDSEMAKITGFQSDILDQPEIVKSKVQDLRDSVLRFHNEARSQRGLPQATKEQVLDNKKRIELYRSISKMEDEYQASQMSNKDLFNTGSWSSGGTSTNTGDVFSRVGL